MIEGLREQMRTHVSTDGQTDHSWILISRSDADSRRLLSEQEAMRRLRPLGVERFVLSELSFQEQIELFSEAETIIAPSGAGLANMMFVYAPRVINLIGHNTNPCHYCLATGIGFEYMCVWMRRHRAWTSGRIRI